MILLCSLGIIYWDILTETRCEYAPSATPLPWDKKTTTISSTATHIYTHRPDTQEMILTDTRVSKVTAETCQWTHCHWGPAACFVVHSSCLHLSLSWPCCLGQQGFAQFLILIKTEGKEKVFFSVLSLSGPWSENKCSLQTFTVGMLLCFHRSSGGQGMVSTAGHERK